MVLACMHGLLVNAACIAIHARAAAIYIAIILCGCSYYLISGGYINCFTRFITIASYTITQCSQLAYIATCMHA